MKTAQGLVGKPSLLVKIPRQPGTIFGGYDAAVAGDTARPGTADSGASAAAGAGAVSGLPPGLTGAGVTPSPSPTGSSTRPPAPATPPNPPAQGYGRLRSLEDR